jgi:hypothetical protein
VTSRSARSALASLARRSGSVARFPPPASRAIFASNSSRNGYSGITDPPRNFRGTYSIQNQRLTFNFADGKRASVAFIAPKALEKAPALEWFGLGHGTGVPGAETVVLLMLYEEHYQVEP